MCIVLLTTSHPKYALVVIDNRDEYILRPTSRPHWWTAHSESDPSVKVDVLSSRDLQRAERGTWLGITKGGNFAVLTNYRELDTHDAAHPVAGKRSRGGMVTAWLGADPAEPTAQFVERMVHSGDVKGVGGFSLICGKLRRKAAAGPEKQQNQIQPLAIMSNRADHITQIPWICGERGKTYGLSNAIYMEPENGNGNNSSNGTQEEKIWPKVQYGADMLFDAATTSDASNQSEEEFISSLYQILDTDRFPSQHDMDLEEGIPFLKNSIFIPAFGGKEHQDEMVAARARGRDNVPPTTNGTNKPTEKKVAAETLKIVARPDDSTPPNGFQTGLYGTQRQTVILVDWEGNVMYRERALYDENGNPIKRGEGDMTFRFRIEGWEGDADGEEEEQARITTSSRNGNGNGLEHRL